MKYICSCNNRTFVTFKEILDSIKLAKIIGTQIQRSFSVPFKILPFIVINRLSTVRKRIWKYSKLIFLYRS